MNRLTKCQQSIAYLKVLLHDDEADGSVLKVSEEDFIANVRFTDDLLISFIYENDENSFTYIQNRTLVEEKLSINELLEYGVNNLNGFIDDGKLRLFEVNNNCFSLILDGNFEASLITLEVLWNDYLQNYVNNEFVVAIPARDILLFCDSNNTKGLQELRNTIDRVWDQGDHLLTNRLLIRRNNKWEYLEEAKCIN